MNSQAVKFALEASAGLKDDYSVDRRFIALELLKQLQTIVVAPPTLPPDSVTMTVSVQPYIPTDSMGYRVISAAKPLKTQLTVKFSPKITNKNALEGVTVPALPPPPPKEAALPAPATADVAVLRTSRDLPRGMITPHARKAPTPPAAPTAISSADLPPLPRPATSDKATPGPRAATARPAPTGKVATRPAQAEAKSDSAANEPDGKDAKRRARWSWLGH